MPTHIQIGGITPRIQFNGDGIQTRFDFPFPIFSQADLEVYIDDTPQAAGFSVYEIAESDGGYIIFDTAPVVDELVTLRRWLGISRTSDFQESGELRANVLNDELDYMIAALQQVAGETTRSLRLSPTDSAAQLELPSS
ncbi:MAG: hydrolase, partial [Rhodospirillaceae bacterium]|nr:hydrolase [Rhodospirillaceae bacterium]